MPAKISYDEEADVLYCKLKDDPAGKGREALASIEVVFRYNNSRELVGITIVDLIEQLKHAS